MTEEVTIERLAAEFVQGSKEACTQIISQFYGSVHNLCCCILQDRDEADDATQETFLKMIKYISQYDTDSKFTPWLYQIAVNTARNMLIKKSPRSFIEQAETIPTPDMKSDPIDIITQEEWISKIATVIEDLSPELKIVMLLKYQQDLENDEITKILSISPGTLRVRLFRAINIIREKLSIKRRRDLI